MAAKPSRASERTHGENRCRSCQPLVATPAGGPERGRKPSPAKRHRPQADLPRRQRSGGARREFGDRVADSIARVGGSWTFIISFIVFLVVWTLGNVWLLGREGFDPYPFIFLNLVLSMIAALQAPVIMMSQNRQSERDRLDAAHDYEVNLKAEIEIMALHEKLDELQAQRAHQLA